MTRPRSIAELNAGQSSFGYHRAVTLGECERLYGFRFGMRLEPDRTADALALGSLLHLAMMHRYRAIAKMDAIDPVEAMRRAPARIAHQFARAADVWSRYSVLAGELDRGMRVLDVEREYEAKIDGHRITARLDLVVAVGREVRVIDHKSTSGDLVGEIRAQAGSGQVALQHMLGESVIALMYELGFGGVWINAVSTSGAEPVALRGRATPPLAWRETVVDALAVLLARARKIESEPDWWTAAGVFRLRANPEACKGRFSQSRCPFYEVCRTGPEALSAPVSDFSSRVDEVSMLREGAGR